MNEQDLIGLSYLEIHAMFLPPDEPARIPMRPETEAWIWVGLVLLGVIAYAIFRWIKYRKANAYRRAAVTALNGAGDDAGAIAAIIRRTALVAYPRSVVASLHGEDWLRFLDQTRGKTGFETDMGRTMLQSPYRSVPAPVDGLSDLAIDWVRHHRAEAPK